jgi:S1-C subfamily serine protease
MPTAASTLALFESRQLRGVWVRPASRYGSPADRAGLRGVIVATGEIGDVVVAANGKPVHRLPDLTDQLEQICVGNKVDLSINRAGHMMSVSLHVADVGSVQ